MRRRPVMVVVIIVTLTLFLSGCEKEKEASGIEEISLEETAESGETEEEDLSGETQEEDKEESGEEPGSIFVYVCGQVAAPGVYELPGDARVYQAIEMAGGTLEGASPESLNLAQQAEDGQKIYVPTEEEAQTGAALQDTPGGVQDTASDQAAGKVNLNTAGLEELMTLTGIGQTRAEAILAYREEEGDFRSPEDIMNVEGIKEGIYEKLKDEITV
nr:helix-hairpin-helix domain-containing protein [Lachnoclostridium phocaeense]